MEEIKPLKGDLSEAVKNIIKLQEELNNKMQNDNILGIPTGYMGLHYCESSGLKCDKQCKYCKDEK